MNGPKSGGGFRGRGALKLIGTERGTGTIRTGAGEAAVTYQVDTYEDRMQRSITGALDGDISFAEDEAAGTLVLQTGAEIAVVLLDPDEEGADFRT